MCFSTYLHRDQSSEMKFAWSLTRLRAYNYWEQESACSYMDCVYAYLQGEFLTMEQAFLWKLIFRFQSTSDRAYISFCSFPHKVAVMKWNCYFRWNRLLDPTVKFEVEYYIPEIWLSINKTFEYSIRRAVKTTFVSHPEAKYNYLVGKILDFCINDHHLIIESITISNIYV